jgi:hypothetical protein
VLGVEGILEPLGDVQAVEAVHGRNATRRRRAGPVGRGPSVPGPRLPGMAGVEIGAAPA